MYAYITCSPNPNNNIKKNYVFYLVLYQKLFKWFIQYIRAFHWFDFSWKWLKKRWKSKWKQTKKSEKKIWKAKKWKWFHFVSWWILKKPEIENSFIAEDEHCHLELMEENHQYHCPFLIQCIFSCKTKQKTQSNDGFRFYSGDLYLSFQFWFIY